MKEPKKSLKNLSNAPRNLGETWDGIYLFGPTPNDVPKVLTLKG
jgi:hypothetical protein